MISLLAAGVRDLTVERAGHIPVPSSSGDAVHRGQARWRLVRKSLPSLTWRRAAICLAERWRSRQKGRGGDGEES